MRACVRCAADISGRHGNARYCGPCGVHSVFTSFACSRKVTAAIKEGRLLAPSRLQCVDCGKPARVYDHRDYSKPLDVAAVCDGCNVRRGPAMWTAAPAEPAPQAVAQ